MVNYSKPGEGKKSPLFHPGLTPAPSLHKVLLLLLVLLLVLGDLVLVRKRIVVPGREAIVLVSATRHVLLLQHRPADVHARSGARAAAGDRRDGSDRDGDGLG